MKNRVFSIVGALMVLVMLLFGLAVAPSGVSATGSSWGMVTKCAGPIGDSNPFISFPYFNSETGLDPAVMYGWSAAWGLYNWVYLYTNGIVAPYNGFTFQQVCGYWVRFAPGYATALNMTYVHFPQAFIERVDLILPGWNMVGSPYGATGRPYPDEVISGTPIDNFQFKNGPNEPWKTYWQAQIADWLPAHPAYWWNCVPQQYWELGYGSQVPRGHGFWLKSNQILYMRVQRPAEIVPEYTGITTEAGLGWESYAAPATVGMPPNP